MPTKIEETVVQSNCIHFQHFAPNCSDFFLERRLRFGEGRAKIRRCVSGAGSRFRSSFPFALRGNSSRKTKVEGIM